MSGKKRNVMLFVLLFTLLLGVIVPVQAQSYGGTKTYGWRIVRTQTLLIKAVVEYTRDMEWNI